MQALIRKEIDADVPAAVLWDYVTDWPRQAEWIPLTRVEVVDGRARAVGERIRAWTGLGPVGFWDTMTITAWEERPDGSGRCEVLHTGKVVKGDGEFAVEALGPGRSRFIWWERVVVPFGPVGALGWRIGGGLFSASIGVALRRLVRRIEAEHAGRSRR